MNKIGIMQGRLSPPLDGRIQSFPWSTWEKEFKDAAALGFDEIEFIFESLNYENNPLLTTQGSDKIKELVAATGVEVNYVCADYFMEKPFFRATESERKQSTETLKKLIEQCDMIGIKGIEIPLVDNSRIETEEEAELFIKSLRECLPVAEKSNIKLGLETSLNPDDFMALLDKIDHPLVGANYDSGNSASLGYDPEEEISKLGKWLYNVHIKDRVLGGDTVPLGEGDADFEKVFGTLGRIGYRGSFILQAARGDDEMEVASRQLEFIQHSIQIYLG